MRPATRVPSPTGRRSRTTAALAASVVLASTGGLLAGAAGAAEAAVTCASPVFTRTFFANTTLTGTPKKTDCDSAIDQNWGSKAPATGLPADNFGVRWTLTRDFGSGGPFRFAAETRDGIRVYLDGVRKADLWKNVSTTQKKTVDVTIPAGTHTLRIDYANFTGLANVKFSYAPLTSATVDKVKPLVPAAPALTYSSYHAALRWSANKEMDLAGYRVYRRADGAAFPAKPLATTTTAAYTDTSLPRTGATYFYEVRAVDKAGNESAGTADKSVTTADRTAPAAPLGVDKNWAMGNVEKVQLFWASSTEPDVVGFRVYRATSRTVPAVPTNLVSGPTPIGWASYQEAVPQTGDWYYYVVTAVDRAGNESAPSLPTQEFMTQDRTPPAETALNARAVEDERGVTLSWDPSAASSADFDGYQVWQSNAPRSEHQSVRLVGDHVRGTSFTDVAPGPGRTYYYWVTAVDRSGVPGTPSVEMRVQVQGNTTAPAAVTGVQAAPKGNGVALSWHALTEPGFHHYVVLRGTQTEGQWTYRPLIDDWTSRPREITGTQYLDRTPADGEQVRYAVVAVDQYGNQLTPATGATVTGVTELDLRPDAAATPAPTGAPVGYLNAAMGNSGSRIGWLGLTPEADAGGHKATGLHVYRWNPATRVFDRLTAKPLARTETSYYDAVLPASTTVFYRVTVTFDDGTESGAGEVSVATY